MELLTGQFITQDWTRIKNALMTYVINEENRLIAKNAGDPEWSELEKYNILISDIELFVLGKK